MIARGKREARRPWLQRVIEESTESAQYHRYLFRSFRASRSTMICSRGDVLASLRTLPLAIIFRAFGATQTFLH